MSAGVMSELLEWGRTLPLWQQAALQLLYEKGSLSTVDISYLAQLSKREAGLALEVSEPPSLTLAGRGSDQPIRTVHLTSIRDTINANALRDGQVLGFARSGLTLVFGDNGAGKSGYVRILKQACHSRGDGEVILTDVYDDSGDPPAATITYIHEDSEKSFRWSSGATTPRELSQVCVLDSRAAVVYADKEQESVFLPFGLDLFPRLTNACDRVAADLAHEISIESGKRDPFRDVPESTKVRTVLSALGTAQALSQLEKLRILSDAERKQVDQLQDEIARLRVEDPAARATELGHKADRFAGVLAALRRIVDGTDEATAQLFVEARARMVAAEAAARALADDTFGHFPIKGLSHETWTVLWKAAVSFAEHGAQPAQGFPTSAGALCLLCQQPVDAKAAARLASFGDFLMADVNATVDKATKELERARQPIDAAAHTAPLDPTQALELDSTVEGLGLGIQGVASSLKARAEALLSGLTQVPPAPSEALQVVDALTRAIDLLRTEALALRATPVPGRLAAATKELDELKARVMLDTIWARVEADHAAALAITAMKRAERSANTKAITEKGKVMLAAAVTAPLAARFQQVIHDLNFRHVPIEMSPVKGRKGRTIHRARIATERECSTLDVLSEGEVRAIAIAGFLAEVEGQESISTVIFDDPVSSLDFNRREYVAKALVEVANRRPVVVFTHDPVFLWMLTTAAEGAVEIQERQLRRVGNEAGIVANSILWSGKPARQRIGPLRDKARRLERLEREDPARYEEEVRRVYRDLRDVWEKAIEDCLLNGGVKRFDRRVQTQRIGRLYLVTAEQMDRLEKGMSRCSEFAHDQPAEPSIPIPEPAAVRADIEACEEWMKELAEQYSKGKAKGTP